MQSMSGLWGKKIGMTQVFSEENQVIPVTVIDVNHWFVTGLKKKDRDGYDAVQVGCLRKKYRGEKFSSDWLKSANKHFYYLREIKLDEPKEDLKLGQPMNFSSVVNKGDKIDVFGLSKGLGFAGVVKRYKFKGGPASHGSTVHRFVGSLSSCGRTGARVAKGKRLPGHKGNDRRMMANLQIVDIKPEDSIMLIKGSIPGKTGSLVFVRKRK